MNFIDFVSCLHRWPALACTAAGLTIFTLPMVAQPTGNQGNQVDNEIAWEAGLPDRQEFQALPVAQTPNQNFWQWSDVNTINSPSQLIQEFYAQALTPQQLGEGDFGCFQSQAATIKRISVESVAVLLTQMGSCDDSVSGQQTRVDFVPNGDRWQVDWVGQRSHCRGRFWGEPGKLCP